MTKKAAMKPARKGPKQKPTIGVPDGSTATPSQFKEAVELATKDLRYRGFQVYGSLSPSDSFDLVIYKDGEFKTVCVQIGDLSHETGQLVPAVA